MSCRDNHGNLHYTFRKGAKGGMVSKVSLYRVCVTVEIGYFFMGLGGRENGKDVI